MDNMHILRIEGVNLSHSIYDTEDLATRRGGSWLLLKAMDSIATRFKGRLATISTGASIGVFEVTEGHGQKALLEEVTEFLSHDPLFKHGCFVVSAPPPDVMALCIEVAINQTRWRQLQTLSFPTLGLAASMNGPCEVDAVRPAADTMTYRTDEDMPVSASVKARRTEGMALKQLLPDEVQAMLHKTGAWPSCDFANDFEFIAKDMPAHIRPRTLDGKLAVFYVDGDKFSRFSRASSEVELRAWDTFMRETNAEVLRTLLLATRDQVAWQTCREHRSRSGILRVPKGAMRLETLLWGGDELRFAVPGWCGLELVDHFFEQVKGKAFNLPAPPKGGQPKTSGLSYSAGLVLCHHQAPISHITALSGKLADLGKRHAPKENSLHWITLESFDQAGGDLDAYLRRRFPEPAAQAVVNWANLGLSPTAINAVRQYLPALKADLPRSAATRALRLLASGEGIVAGKVHPLLERSYAMVDKAVGANVHFTALWQALHHDPARRTWQAAEPAMADLCSWVKLIELWDYAVALPAAADKGALA